jgi:hypothetical protein
VKRCGQITLEVTLLLGVPGTICRRESPRLERHAISVTQIRECTLEVRALDALYKLDHIKGDIAGKTTEAAVADAGGWCPVVVEKAMPHLAAASTTMVRVQLWEVGRSPAFDVVPIFMAGALERLTGAKWRRYTCVVSLHFLFPLEK